MLTRAAVLAVVAALGLAPGVAARGRHARHAGIRASAVKNEVRVTLTTANLSRALTSMPAVHFGALRPAIPVITVNDTIRYQRMLGFGAAMTDTSAWLLYDELPPARRLGAMAALFGPDGIRLDYMRVPMAASDFTHDGVPYSYDDVPAGQSDPTLAAFSIAHDQAYVLPALRMMLAFDPRTTILAEPWSAPGWMKQNQALDNVGFAGVLDPGAYQAYADYFVKFIDAYEQAGVPVTAVTPVNEAHTSSQYPGMDLDEATFLTGYLVPTLRAAGLRTRVYSLDGSGFDWQATQLQSAIYRAAIAGTAAHCYAGLDQLNLIHALDPQSSIIMDECSPGIVPYPASEVAIASARNWAQAVDLWNLALDPTGGPRQAVPGCTGCGGLLTVDELTHTVRPNVNYYQLGQASKFVQRGAWRIASDRWVSDYAGPSGYGVTPGVDNTAFENPDGTKVLVAYNSGPRTRFQVRWRSRAFTYTLGSGATATFTWR